MTKERAIELVEYEVMRQEQIAMIAKDNWRTELAEALRIAIEAMK